ncbi:hypothetical protein DM01DRAFT_1087827 [Hesseltinella vesiculosa]|uniref:[histone H3]-lysine(36) N-trimethyltransferase n=1 Tax=Hesseltinella vesiculosa TaxID=101127 RepID=A0A1X2GDM1_9FUNG|nr:hypothetical protein DM01DRAFT_1087827 [Hesseltinella vesiculosa]
MATYQNIDYNIYFGSATGKSIAEESMPCECKYDPGVDDPLDACGDDGLCINRMMFMECMLDDCPCDRYCRNRRFQLRQYARVDVIRTEKKGFGLRALTDLPKNAFVMEYVGEVIPNREFILRTQLYEVEGLKHYYFMTLKTDEIIDATKKGCLARFINHSCNPNSVTQKWVVGKTMRIGIFTQKAIKAGTELTFDYKFERYGAKPQKCYCNEANCKGYIGGANKVSEDDDEVYTPNGHVYDMDDSTDMAVTLTQKRMVHKSRKTKPLRDLDHVKEFVIDMLDSVGNRSLVVMLLDRLELTGADGTDERDVWKKFIRLHGLRMLKCWLGEWKAHDDIVEKVLRVLVKLPLANRNGLEDTNMFDIIHRLQGSENQNINHLVETLLDNWKDLKSVYRIPKRAYVEQPSTEKSQGTKKRQHAFDGDSFLLPAIKRPPYVSTRDFMDPDDDYYEYLTYDASLEEIQSRFYFLPMPQIPTAPRAMLEYAYQPYGDESADWDGSVQQENTSQNLPTGPSNNFYDAFFGSNQPQDENVAEHSSPSTDHHTGNLPPSSSEPTDADNRPLPPDWCSATTSDNQVYYYHRLTNETQWTFPEDSTSFSSRANSPADYPLPSPKIERSPSISSHVSTKTHHIAPSTPRSSSSPLRPSNKPSSSSYAEWNHGELKKEISMVVTRSLTKHKSLWDGDKQFFKELARKITHHIVEREIHSSRKLRTMNSALRSKIEKLIENHGASFVDKIKGKKHKDTGEHSSPPSADSRK